jgi:hypothetical protein
MSRCLGIIDDKSIHIREYSDGFVDHSFCGRSFEKGKFNTISFDNVKDENFCSECIAYSGFSEDPEPRYYKAHLVAQNISFSRNREPQQPMKIFAYKLSRFKYWASRRGWYRPILKGRPK